mmetsp:Transcript_36049/g.73514  ORF Transcript_36049/g.73514 Transcript_36049/m.73514 type:complete len:93 (+) Transcript_36049:698-976(+)
MFESDCKYTAPRSSALALERDARRRTALEIFIVVDEKDDVILQSKNYELYDCRNNKRCMKRSCFIKNGSWMCFCLAALLHIIETRGPANAYH